MSKMLEFRIAVDTDPMVHSLYQMWLRGEFSSFEDFLLEVVNQQQKRYSNLLLQVVKKLEKEVGTRTVLVQKADNE